MKKISSNATSGYKFIPIAFILFIISHYGLIIFNLIINKPSGIDIRGFITITSLYLFLFLVIFLRLRFLLYIKDVYLGDKHFIVQDKDRNIQIPFEAIIDIKGSRFISPDYIILYTSYNKPLKKIYFIPPIRMFKLFSQHPIFSELWDKVYQKETA